MTTAAAISFAGALLGIAIFSRIPIWALRAWKEMSLRRLLAAHLLTYVAAVAISAFALAHGGQPQWQVAVASFVVPSALVFALDALGIYFKMSDGTGPIAWFTHVGGKRTGPMATEAITTALADGSLKPTDWIWRVGFKEWQQVQTVDVAATAEPAPAPAGPRTPYLLRHWQGMLSLPRSFWLSGLLIAFVFGVLYVSLIRLDIADYPILVSAGVIGLWLALLAAMVWFAVGVVRAAERYEKDHPKRIWSITAKGATVIAALSVLAVFARLGVPQIQHFADAIFETTEPRYTVALLRDDTELNVTGPMDLGLSETVDEVLHDNPAIATIYLNSPEGRPAEGDRLSEIILANNLNTYVTAVCAGPCIKAFAAGKNRWLSRNAVLALARPESGEQKTAAPQPHIVKLRSFLRGRGVETGFIERALAVTEKDAWRPSHAELFASGLVTSYATDADVAQAGIPLQEIDDAEKALDQVALYRALREKHPKAREEIFAILREGTVKGEAAAEMRRRMWTIITPVVAQSISSASDAALASFYQVAAEEAEALAVKDPRSCEAFLKGETGGFDPAMLSASLRERELTATAELIRTSGSYVGQPIEQKDVEAPLMQLLLAATADGFTAAEFRNAIEFKLDAARNCKGTILFLKSLQGVSEPGRSVLLRFVAQRTAALQRLSRQMISGG
jgi:uncharacterized membrane protein